jgi:hypothetical protein
MPSGLANGSAAVVLLVLSGAPWFLKGPAAAAGDERLRKFEEEREREQKIIEQIEALPADTRLEEFLAYIEMPPGKALDFRGPAIKRMTAIPTRQNDADALLERSDSRMLSVLGDLDLAMTPSLCEAARKCARSVAGQLKPQNPATSFEAIEPSFNKYTPALAWMLKNGCDCKAEIAEIERTARLYPESFPRKWFTDYLLEMQGKPREP